MKHMVSLLFLSSSGLQLCCLQKSIQQNGRLCLRSLSKFWRNQCQTLPLLLIASEEANLVQQLGVIQQVSKYLDRIFCPPKHSDNEHIKPISP